MAQRAGVSFELERLDLQGDELVVTGHWSGVRGLRFVRPTLVADDRRILATLEHKPWAPSLDHAWIAAFPWDRPDVDAGALALAVAPQVTVPLGGAALAGPEPEPASPPAPVTPIRAPPPEPAPEPPDSEPDPEPELPPAAAAPRAAPAADRVEALEGELAAVTRERDAQRQRVKDLQASAARDRERARAQLEEAVTAREAAVRTRARMERAHDEALRAREHAEAALASAQAQRDEANAQRDEVLLAYRALQRHVRTERAHEDRARDGDAADEGETGGGGEPAGAADPEEEPIGVRTMPAARTVMAELQRPTKLPGKLPFSIVDLWVIRVLGTVAAACFILLLVSILRVFV